MIRGKVRRKSARQLREQPEVACGMSPPEDKPFLDCPDEYFCSISLELMVNPVKLDQTGQVYDHASFHEWLTQGVIISGSMSDTLEALQLPVY